jgi:hypothetical protein
VDSEIALNSRLALSYRDASEKKIDTGAAESTGAHRAMDRAGRDVTRQRYGHKAEPLAVFPDINSEFNLLNANLVMPGESCHGPAPRPAIGPVDQCQYELDNKATII